jgi:hypothetical protein
MQVMTLWRVAACLLTVTVATGCATRDDSAPPTPVGRTPSGSGAENGPTPPPDPDPSTTSVVDGRTVEAAAFTETAAGLCLARQQASTDVRAARATYDTRSRAGVENTSRALQDSYSIQAAAVAKAKALVEADLGTDPPKPSLGLNLALLGEEMRESLALLGIQASPCER